MSMLGMQHPEDHESDNDGMKDTAGSSDDASVNGEETKENAEDAASSSSESESERESSEPDTERKPTKAEQKKKKKKKKSDDSDTEMKNASDDDDDDEKGAQSSENESDDDDDTFKDDAVQPAGDVEWTDEQLTALKKHLPSTAYGKLATFLKADGFTGTSKDVKKKCAALRTLERKEKQLANAKSKRDEKEAMRQARVVAKEAKKLIPRVRREPKPKQPKRVVVGGYDSNADADYEFKSENDSESDDDASMQSDEEDIDAMNDKFEHIFSKDDIRVRKDIKFSRTNDKQLRSKCFFKKQPGLDVPTVKILGSFNSDDHKSSIPTNLAKLRGLPVLYPLLSTIGRLRHDIKDVGIARIKPFVEHDHDQPDINSHKWLELGIIGRSAFDRMRIASVAIQHAIATTATKMQRGRDGLRSPDKDGQFPDMVLDSRTVIDAIEFTRR